MLFGLRTPLLLMLLLESWQAEWPRGATEVSGFVPQAQ
jgi:hypothetical protein